MNRIFDIVLSIIGLILFLPIMFIIFIICFFETGSPVFKQQRIGRYKKPFFLYKFRSMYLNTKSVSTHLVDSKSITTFGGFLRRSKMDELPQLWNVFIGDMSIVGPRPNLFNQKELIKERDLLGIYEYRPGITGLAQIKKIDMSSPKLLAETDYEMLKMFTFRKYITYIIQTILGKGFGDRIIKIN